MNKKSARFFITLMAAIICMAALSFNALAFGDDPAAEQTVSPAPTASPTVSASPAVTPTPVCSPAVSANPLTPNGTGTVVDNVTNEDDKEFFTITTPSKHIFYLIIDRQKNKENVYFLDSVTEKDLLALAQSSSSVSASPKVSEAPKASTTPSAPKPETTTTPAEPGTQNNTAGIVTAVLLLLVVASAALWFLKFRKPKKQTRGKSNLDDYNFPEDEDDDMETETEEQSLPSGKTDSTQSETEDDE